MTFAFHPRRFALPVIAILLGVVSLALPGQPPENAAAAAGQRRPVLVELFTSEGCSSCPPADALLVRLDTRQFVPGAQAIVLSEHVTYWNHLGWRDPFSLDSVTERQQQYAARFGLDGVYTPQVVVNGATELVGSDESKLSRAIAQAVSTRPSLPAVDLAIEDARWSGGAVHFKVRAAGPAPEGTLFAALAEDSAQSSVARGENAGRIMRHVAVVRVLEELGKNALDGRELALHIPGGAGPDEPKRLVVFLTDRRSGRVMAAAEQTLTLERPAADGLQATSSHAPEPRQTHRP